MSAFVVLHGLENHRWPGHWQRHLVTELRSQGHLVIYPQLPNPDAPVQAEWTEVVRTEFALLHESGIESVTVVAHSLSGLNMCALLAEYQPPVAIERLLLVAPADPHLIAQRTDFRVEVDSEEVRAGIARSVGELTIIASESDEWLPRGIESTYSDALRVAPILFEGAGHIAMGDGFGRWPGVIDWCLDSTSLLTRREV